MRIRSRTLPIVLLSVTALLASACGRSERGQSAGQSTSSEEIVAQVASYDLVAGRSGRFIVGVLAADRARLVAFGSVRCV